jgi:hypothetical protein
VEIIFDSKTTFSKNLPRQQTVLIARDSLNDSEAVDMNGVFQMQGGKNWILPK